MASERSQQIPSVLVPKIDTLIHGTTSKNIPEKSEKIIFTNFFDKNVALGQNPETESSQVLVIYPLGHGHITKNGKITIFYLFLVPDIYF